MAYTDLVSSQTTVATDTATTYNFAYDLPAATDNSPHVVQMGFLLRGTFSSAATITSNLTGLINRMRIKVGANTIINWDDVVTTGANTVCPQLSVLIQKLGGVDQLSTQAGAGGVGTAQDFQAMVTFPVGLDASRAHRVNVQLGFDAVSTWSGQAGGSGFAAGCTLDMVHIYGTARQAVIVGSRQDSTGLTDGAENVLTYYGRKGWNMLGIMLCNASLTADGWTDIRVNNGAFRDLPSSVWRMLNGTGTDDPLRIVDSYDAATDEQVAPQWVVKQDGVEFLDLRRLTAGANIDMTVTSNGGVTISGYPIWVASIGAGTGSPPGQTAKSVQDTVKQVISEGPQ